MIILELTSRSTKIEWLTYHKSTQLVIIRNSADNAKYVEADRLVVNIRGISFRYYVDGEASQ